MTKMREEFEALALLNHNYDAGCAATGYYYVAEINRLWSCWQASRAALCVDMPSCWNDEQRDYRDDMVKSLDYVGVSHR